MSLKAYLTLKNRNRKEVYIMATAIAFATLLTNIAMLYVMLDKR
jgi:hypothetical protein